MKQKQQQFVRKSHNLLPATSYICLEFLKILFFKLFFILYSITRKDEDRQKRDDMPSLFEIVLDPSVLLEKTTQEPTIFDIVLRPEKFIYDSSEEVSEEVEFQTSDVEDYNRFKYEFTTESREELIPAGNSTSNSATSNYTYYPAVPG